MPKKDLDADDEKYIADAAREIEAGESERQEPETKEEKPEKGTRGNVIDLDAEPEDDEAEQRPSAREKRRNRYREAMEAKEAAEARARDVEQRLRQAELAREAMAIAMQQGGRPQDGSNPIDKEIERVDAEIDDLDSYFRRLTPQEQPEKLAEFRAKVRRLEHERTQLFIKKQYGDQPKPPTGPELFMQSTFPDVHVHPAGPAVVNSHYQRLVALGHPQNIETFREAAELTRGELFPDAPKRRTVGAPPANSAMKAKLGFSGGGRAGGAPGRTGRVINMDAPENKAHRQMARATYPNMPERKAYETYARNYMADDD